jgi:hypothetical protein
MYTPPMGQPASARKKPLSEHLAAFRKMFILEEVQEELWRCFQPRLLASLREPASEEAEVRAALYEQIELLLVAIYHSPVPPAPPAAEVPTPDGNAHG